MKPFEAEKRVLPDFGRTHHLPWRANGSDDDSVAREEYAGMIFHGELTVEEKIDGACVGIRHTGDEPILRNREHILRKGYIKDTPSKMQFRPLWGWYYDHRESFEKLNALLGIEASVYGEWLYAKHTLYYDRLPALFVAHSIWDPADGSFVPQPQARDALVGAGFSVPRLIATRVPSVEALYGWMDLDSEFGDCKVEGVYVKVSDPVKDGVVHRFKMVRPDFRSDPNWVHRPLVRNLVSKDFKVTTRA